MNSLLNNIFSRSSNQAKPKYPDGVLTGDKNKLYFEVIDLTLSLDIDTDRKISRLLLERYSSLLSLKARFGESFLVERAESSLLVSVEEIVFNVCNAVDFFILDEVFVQRVYDFRYSSSCVVIDIGMNVGIASLFFARNNNVVQVHGFEPAKDTLSLAKHNFGLNPELAAKIESYPYGLCSGSSRNESFIYNTKNPGSFGLVGQNKFKAQNHDTIEVRLESAHEALATICEGVSENDLLVVKIDCEGCEYEVIPELMRLKRQPELIMAEWHLGRGEDLVATLQENDYVVIFNQTERTAGIIYANRPPL